MLDNNIRRTLSFDVDAETQEDVLLMFAAFNCCASRVQKKYSRLFFNSSFSASAIYMPLMFVPEMKKKILDKQNRKRKFVCRFGYQMEL